jgi:hypothetical protein
VSAPSASLSFAVPDGRLEFASGELDRWAEHLAWCYRLLGVHDGDTVAVQDFGPSPLAFLGSSLVTPLLEAGVAERLTARVVCLDASHERVALTPRLLAQMRPDVLVVRSSAVALLLAAASEAGVASITNAFCVIVAVTEDEPPPALGADWRLLLAVERSLLLAPSCGACGRFHLRAGRYDFDGETARALGARGAAPYAFRTLLDSRRGGCAAGPEDWRLRLALDGRDE